MSLNYKFSEGEILAELKEWKMKVVWITAARLNQMWKKLDNSAKAVIIDV